MIRRLRIKLILINMTVVTVLLTVSLGLTYCFTASRLEIHSIRMMQKLAAAPFREAAGLEGDEEIRLPYIAIRLGPDDRELETAGGYYDLTQEEVEALVSAAQADGKRAGVLQAYHLRYCSIQGPHNQYLIFADISSEIQALNSLKHICTVIGVLAFLGFLAGSILLSGWAVRPVDRAFQAQQQFIADASHELKTPLTVIKTNAQILQKYPSHPQYRERSVASILMMSDQMQQLMEQMLTLARGDWGREEKIREPLDFSTLVRQSMLAFDPVFFEQGNPLEQELPETLNLPGDPAELRKAVEILLDNAAKYTSPGAAVRVSLSEISRRRCRLTVANRGKPMTREQLTRIFDRFASGDPARNKRGSFGLGLPIARSIARRHGGRLWAESKNGVNSFHLELPTR